jgi:hypothetical protein
MKNNQESIQDNKIGSTSFDSKKRDAYLTHWRLRRVEGDLLYG